MTKSIFKTVDQYGPIEVFDVGAKRYLTFGNDHEQSLQIKATPHIPQHEYGRAIMLSLLFLPDVLNDASNHSKNIAILGLGGGTLANAFLQAANDIDVHVIELRMAVIKIAQHYFQLEKHPRLHVHHSDGVEHLNGNDAKYDLLIADMYHEDGIDQQQLQLDFIHSCEKNLSEKGILVLNYWLDHDLESGLLSLLNQHFEQLFICNSGGGNVIIYACKNSIEHDYLDKNLVKPLAKKLGFSLNYYLKRLKILS